MANNNSIAPYVGATLKEQQEQSGIGRFYGEFGWAITEGGFLKQGNRVTVTSDNAPLSISFNEAFPKQCLGIFVQAIIAVAGGTSDNDGKVQANSETTNGFTLLSSGIAKSYYWWAIGV